MHFAQHLAALQLLAAEMIGDNLPHEPTRSPQGFIVPELPRPYCKQQFASKYEWPFCSLHRHGALLDTIVIVAVRYDCLVGPGFLVEPDRMTAIATAIRLAEPGDAVLIAGKGHETYQILADETIHFDDREAARKVLAANPDRSMKP